MRHGCGGSAVKRSLRLPKWIGTVACGLIVLAGVFCLRWSFVEFCYCTHRDRVLSSLGIGGGCRIRLLVQFPDLLGAQQSVAGSCFRAASGGGKRVDGRGCLATV